MFTSLFRSRPVLLTVLILLLGIAYAGQSGGETMFDDDHQLIHVSAFGSVADTFSVDFLGFFRPVKNLVFYTWVQLLPDQYPLWRLTAVAAFLGLIPIAYQFFGLFWKKQPYLQLLSTALWACAPAMTTVVSWISSTNILIGGYGFFLYFLWYEKARAGEAEGKTMTAYSWKFASLLMLALACLSYEAAVTAPFLLVLKDFVLHQDRLKEKRCRIHYGLSCFVLALYLLLRKVHGGVATFDIATTIPSDSDFWVSLSSGWMYLFHAIRWVWPFGHQGILIMFNPENHKLLVIAAALVVLAIGLTALYFRRRQPEVFLGVGWYAMALFPMANVIPLRNGPIADYYLFLPGIGLAFLLSFLAKTLYESRHSWTGPALGAGWAGLLGLTTILWTPHWKSQRALAERTEAWQPDNFVILESLAKVELEDKNFTRAESYLDRGLALAPWYSRLHYYKVMLFIDQGRAEEAENLLAKLMEHQADSPKPYVFQAYVSERLKGDWHAAERLLATALEKPWDNRFSRMGAMHLASIYQRTERPQFTLKIYETLHIRYPADPEIAAHYAELKKSNGITPESSNLAEVR